jgi:transcriptional regulator with XRE-family HTH domain
MERLRRSDGAVLFGNWVRAQDDAQVRIGARFQLSGSELTKILAGERRPRLEVLEHIEHELRIPIGLWVKFGGVADRVGKRRTQPKANTPKVAAGATRNGQLNHSLSD